MSGTGRGPVELSAGGRIALAGSQWRVQEFEPHTGRVLLRRDDGQELATTIRALVNRGDCGPVPGSGESRIRRRAWARGAGRTATATRDDGADQGPRVRA